MKKSLNHHHSTYHDKKKSAAKKNIFMSREYDKEMEIREESRIVQKQYLRGW